MQISLKIEQTENVGGLSVIFFNLNKPQLH